MANKITVAASPLTRKIYAGRLRPAEKRIPNGPQQWASKEDVTEQAVIAVAQHLGKPGVYLELGTDGQRNVILALLSNEDFALLEAARLAYAKEKAEKNG